MAILSTEALTSSSASRCCLRSRLCILSKSPCSVAIMNSASRMSPWARLVCDVYTHACIEGSGILLTCSCCGFKALETRQAQEQILNPTTCNFHHIFYALRLIPDFGCFVRKQVSGLRVIHSFESKHLPHDFIIAHTSVSIGCLCRHS
jgi:hypothetical protein